MQVLLRSISLQYALKYISSVYYVVPKRLLCSLKLAYAPGQSLSVGLMIAILKNLNESP